MLAGPEGHSREGKRMWRSLSESLLAWNPFSGIIEIKEAPSAGVEHRTMQRAACPRGRAEVHTCKASAMNTQESSSLLSKGVQKLGAEGSPAQWCWASLYYHTGKALPSPP